MAYATSLAGSKLRAKLGASLNEQVSAPTSDFAQRQLKLMGWTEGEGLGKKRQGRSSHIKVKRREDNVGLGHGQQQIEDIKHEASWWKHSMGDTLAKLSKGKKKSKKNSKKRHYTDEELFEATGGARFGMRAQRRATGKWARTESNVTDNDEEEAKARLEWNGRGEAKTILTTLESDESKSGNTSSGEEADTKNNKKRKKSSDKKKKKKRKKSSKKEE